MLAVSSFSQVGSYTEDGRVSLSRVSEVVIVVVMPLRRRLSLLRRCLEEMVVLVMPSSVRGVDHYKGTLVH